MNFEKNKSSVLTLRKSFGYVCVCILKYLRILIAIDL